MLQCSQYTQNGSCSVQSCTCYANTPTAYCGVFYRTSDGAFFWCGGGYNTRRAECEEAARLLGVDQLRDVSVGDLSRVEALPEPLGKRGFWSCRAPIFQGKRIVIFADEAYEGTKGSASIVAHFTNPKPLTMAA